MMIMALTWALILVALLAILGAAATLRGTDSRESYVDDQRR
jgi:hypothetical protein